MSQWNTRRDMLLGSAAGIAAGLGAGPTLAQAPQAQPPRSTPNPAQAGGGQPRRPNILVIWGDDIGWQNVSAYGLGTMDSFGHLAQRTSWIFEPMSELIKEHLETLREFPPVQRGASISLANAVEQFLQRARQ